VGIKKSVKPFKSFKPFKQSNTMANVRRVRKSFSAAARAHKEENNDEETVP
jgi:hypothetical protein